MGTFQESYICLLEIIEEEFNINLTFAEKISLRCCLKYSQENLCGRDLKDKCGGFQIAEVKLMYLRQFGIVDYDTQNIRSLPKFKEYFKRIRDECLL